MKGYNEEVLARNEIKDAVSKKRVIHWIDSLVLWKQKAWRNSCWKYNLHFFIFAKKPLPKVLDEDEMDEEEEPLDEENYSTTLIDYVTVNFVSSQEIEKLKKQNP